MENEQVHDCAPAMHEMMKMYQWGKMEMRKEMSRNRRRMLVWMMMEMDSHGGLKVTIRQTE